MDREEQFKRELADDPGLFQLSTLAEVLRIAADAIQKDADGEGEVNALSLIRETADRLEYIAQNLRDGVPILDVVIQRPQS